MTQHNIKYIADHKCQSSGKLHKVAVVGHGPVDLQPKIGDMVEYDCPDCNKTHQFKPKVWSGPNAPFPAKHYLSGRIIKSV